MKPMADRLLQVAEASANRKRNRFEQSKGYSIVEAKFYTKFGEPYFCAEYIHQKTKARKTYNGPVRLIQGDLGASVSDFLTGLVIAAEQTGGE